MASQLTSRVVYERLLDFETRLGTILEDASRRELEQANQASRGEDDPNPILYTPTQPSQETGTNSVTSNAVPNTLESNPTTRKRNVWSHEDEQSLLDHLAAGRKAREVSLLMDKDYTLVRDKIKYRAKKKRIEQTIRPRDLIDEFNLTNE
jgi:hypothetical protein